VTVINVTTGTVQGAPIVVGDGPRSLAISNDGKTAYVANFADNTVSVINVTTGTVQGAPIAVGVAPYSIALTPNGSTGYVTNYAARGTVSVIATR
jgi:YVTN family beta-propeller protein